MTRPAVARFRYVYSAPWAWNRGYRGTIVQHIRDHPRVREQDALALFVGKDGPDALYENWGFRREASTMSATGDLTSVSTDFRSAHPHAVAALMQEFTAPWCIAGGWALDLYLGQVTRPHSDVDLLIFREDQTLLRRYLSDWTFEKVVDGLLTPWRAEEWLPPPVHEVHARSSEHGSLALEFLLNERRNNQWVFRRNPEVSCPLDGLILRSDAGLPVVCPAVVLLYKAKAPRAADEADFDAVRSRLGAEQREWLRSALRVTHPGHRWLARI